MASKPHRLWGRDALPLAWNPQLPGTKGESVDLQRNGDWRLPEPCQGSGGFNTVTMPWKSRGNKELHPLPEPPLVLTQISKWYLDHPVFLSRVWGKVLTTILITFSAKKNKEIYSKPILVSFIHCYPLYHASIQFCTTSSPHSPKSSYLTSSY